MTSAVVTLLEALVRLPSITPNDAGCQDLLIVRLKKIGFSIEEINVGQVKNLWARRGESKPLIVFAGHTDVVPTGPLEKWASDPFIPSLREGKLYGRGASDMKGSIAAFIVAIEEFVAQHPDHSGSIGLLMTSDEEGPALDGTIQVCKRLLERQETPDCCIVGEPTSVKQVGDMIKNGRRGSLSGKLTIIGLQGHVAYPHLARNPIHLAMPAFAELTNIVWDEGNEFFPPTSLQFSNISAGTGASNVIADRLIADFNFRFSTASLPEQLKARFTAVLDKHHLTYELDWNLGGEPFLTAPGHLSKALIEAIKSETGFVPELSTTGGTSDGRFIAKICPQVIEFGPPNHTIHQVNEYIELQHLEPLKNIYRKTLNNLLCEPPDRSV